MTTEASQLADFTKFEKIGSLNDFLRCVAILAVFCLVNCLMTTEASRLADFTKFVKFYSINDCLHSFLNFHSL